MSESSRHTTFSISPTSIFPLLLALSLCALPIVGVIAPRSLGFLPAVVGVLGYLGHWFVYKSRPPFCQKTLKLIVPVFLLACVSCLWSIDFEISFERCLKLFPVFLGGFLLISLIKIQNEQFYNYFAKLFFFAFLISCAICAFEMLSNGFLHSYIRDVDQRFSKNLSHLNRSVIIVTLFVFLIIPLLKEFSKDCRLRTTIFGALFLTLIAIVFSYTDSQSAHLAFLVGVLAYFLIPMQYNVSWKILSALLALLVFVTPWLAQYLFNTLPSLIEDIHWFRTSYAMDRLEIWDFVSRYALTNPWVGHGIESTRAVEAFDNKMLYHKDLTILHPHNFAVQAWMEFGLIGAVCLSIGLAYLLKLIHDQLQDASKFTLALFMAFISVAATGYGFWQGWFVGLMLTGAAYCLIITRYCALKNNPKA